jgi:hypothetical protein
MIAMQSVRSARSRTKKERLILIRRKRQDAFLGRSKDRIHEIERGPDLGNMHRQQRRSPPAPERQHQQLERLHHPGTHAAGMLAFGLSALECTLEPLAQRSGRFLGQSPDRLVLSIGTNQS